MSLFFRIGLVPLLMLSILTGCGSKPSDLTGFEKAQNPLPPCPDSPNCIRLTKSYRDSLDKAWVEVLNVLREMKPYTLEATPDEYRIDAVFLVVFFKDDMVLQLEKAGAGTLVHIRSASRIGYTDLGVNRRRVKRFLKKLEAKVKGE